MCACLPLHAGAHPHQHTSTQHTSQGSASANRPKESSEAPMRKRSLPSPACWMWTPSISWSVAANAFCAWGGGAGLLGVGATHACVSACACKQQTRRTCSAGTASSCCPMWCRHRPRPRAATKISNGPFDSSKHLVKMGAASAKRPCSRRLSACRYSRAANCEVLLAAGANAPACRRPTV